jgi:hypothetical protein
MSCNQPDPKGRFRGTAAGRLSCRRSQAKMREHALRAAAREKIHTITRKRLIGIETVSVRTVAGDVDVGVLDATNCHEHLLTSPSPSVRGDDDDLVLND